ncbi:DUF3800 domain-containing protein [Mollicutes bacterium LVI A0078]|nr:DUF3800 domain-containing protein [Mollicutes bacterium LVI A0075]WOO90926.1 DUF3800 domain-containing protein [Mollicutes bacterium LVI A0078]
MRTIRIGIDESGTFGSGNYFVLAGYLIEGNKYKSKMYKYKRVEQSISHEGELKASLISTNQKLQLLDVMKNQKGYVTYINNSDLQLPSSTLDKQILKDDLLIRLLISIIRDIPDFANTKIVIYIDEQNLRNGLKDNVYINLYKVLNSGYFRNHKYVRPLAIQQVELEVIYVDSRKSTLVRAADNLANYGHNQLRKNEPLASNLKIFKIL